MGNLVWALAALVLVIVLAALTVQWAVGRNGPAVLDAFDRLTGGARGAIRLATLSTGEHPSQKLVIWGPREPQEARDPLPVLIFAHGGSWNSGDPEDYGFLARAFVPQGFLVVLIGYRLVTQTNRAGVYPDMIEDTATAIRRVYDGIARYGGDPDRMVMMGHSAGAYNVMMTAMEETWLSQSALSPEGLSANTPRGVVALAGHYDFYPFDSPATIGAFGAAPDPEATQVFNHVRGDAPPVLLIHGEEDTRVGPRHSRELARMIEAAGGDVTLTLYPGMGHVDPLVSLASPWRERRDVADRIAAFAKTVTQDTAR